MTVTKLGSIQRLSQQTWRTEGIYCNTRIDIEWNGGERNNGKVWGVKRNSEILTQQARRHLHSTLYCGRGYNTIHHIHCRSSRHHRRSKISKEMCPTTLRPGNIAGQVWVHSLRLAARLTRYIPAKPWHLFRRRVINYVVDRGYGG